MIKWTIVFSLAFIALAKLFRSFICGDFNWNLLNSETSKSFIERMNSLGPYTTNFNNRIHYYNDGATLLDLFFSNNIENCLHYDQLSASAFSKHDVIFATFIIVPQTLPTTYEYRDFKNIDLAQLEEDIHQIDWQQLYFMNSADDQADGVPDRDALMKFIRSAVDDCYEDDEKTQKVEVTDAGFESLITSDPSPPRNTKCMRYCVMKAHNLYNDDGTLNTTEMLGLFKKVYPDIVNDENLKIIADTGDECMAEVTVEDRCEKAHDMAMCVISKLSDQGLDIKQV